jgi:biotin transport system substrate-specific component
MSSVAVSGVLADRWSGGVVRSVVLVTVGAAVTGIAAQVSIPLPGTPVPLTLQTLAVLLVGAAMGRTLGALSMVLYVAAGLLGVPWFAGQTSGVHSATLGYLVGFIAAAWLTGQLAARGRDRNFWSATGLMILGNVVIYAFGVPILALAIGVSLPQAVMLGVVPFLIGDGIKILAAAGLLPAAWTLVNKGGK